MSQTTALSVTLSEVLHYSLPPGTQVLAGDQALGGRVHWCRLIRTRPAGLGSVEPGELLILPGGLLESLGERRVVGRVVGELVEAGASAFAVAGSPHEALLEACDGARIPLLQVPGGTPLVEVERAVISLILDRDAQLRRRAEEIHTRLLGTMLGNAGLQALVESLAEATGLGAAVFDDYGALQACAPADESFRQTLVAGTSSLLLREVGTSGVRYGRPLAVRFADGEATWSGHLHPLQIGSTWAGSLALLGRHGAAGELDRLLADRAATLVALEVAKQRAVAEATQRWRGELLDDLLEGNFPSDEAALARGRQLGHDLLTLHLVARLAADPPAVSTWADGQLSSTRQRRRFADVGRATLLRLEPRALVVERDGALVALLPQAEADAATQSTACVERLRVAVAEALGGLAVSAGIGRVVRQPIDFAAAQQEATQAVVIAQKLLGGERTVNIAGLGVERLLYHLLGRPELEQFALDVLGDLLTYDAEHRGELVRTLEVFLSCNGNHVRAAQELHLHRNTLLYRLERAREILGRDLEDSETRLALQVALRIRGAITPSATPAPTTSLRRTAGRRRRAG